MQSDWNFFVDKPPHHDKVSFIEGEWLRQQLGQAVAVQIELLLKHRGRQGTTTSDPVPFWVLKLLAKCISLSQQQMCHTGFQLAADIPPSGAYAMFHMLDCSHYENGLAINNIVQKYTRIIAKYYNLCNTSQHPDSKAGVCNK